jgi:Dyp-type peroxidase family
MKRKDEPCGPYYAQNPLTLIMRIKPEQVRPHLSNADAMKGALVKFGVTGDSSLSNDAKIHFARFVFLENDTQMGVITSYDFSFEDYIFTFLKNFGELFDDLFQYVVDPPPSPVREHPEAFGDYVYRNDIKPFIFFGAYEDLSVANILNQFGRIAREVTPEKPTKPAEIPTPPDLNLADIQGFVLRGYRMHLVRHFVLGITDPDAARAWVGSLVGGDPRATPQITSARPWSLRPPYCLNAGFTVQGLRRLGVPEGEIALMDPSFVRGAVKQAASIGDCLDSAPQYWVDGLRPEDGADQAPADVVVSLYADAPEELEGWTARLRQAWEGALRELSAHDGQALPERRVHFGYVDGIAQPEIRGVPWHRPSDAQPTVPPGDFVLGYTSQYGVEFHHPKFAANGSYACVRFLKQDVAGFDRFLREGAAQTGLSEEDVAAKLCGRWRNGQPLVRVPLDPHQPLERRTADDFDYVNAPEWQPPEYNDYDGYRCPHGAHIRRTNPRSSLVDPNEGHRHRLIRRGVPYGPPFDPANPDDGIERGLLGLFLCGQISQQFEFITRSWMGQGGFVGPLATDTKDPISGDTQNIPQEDRVFTIPRPAAEGGDVNLTGFPQFTITRGGAYCFLPSLSAFTAISRRIGA